MFQPFTSGHLTFLFIKVGCILQTLKKWLVFFLKSSTSISLLSTSTGSSIPSRRFSLCIDVLSCPNPPPSQKKEKKKKKCWLLNLIWSTHIKHKILHLLKCLPSICSQTTPPTIHHSNIGGWLDEVGTCILLFSLFIRTSLVVEESIVFSVIWHFGLDGCTIKVFLWKIACFNLKCHYVYIAKIHKYERTFVLKKECSQRFPKFSNAHKVPQDSHAYSKVLITYEPWNAYGSHHLCTLSSST